MYLVAMVPSGQLTNQFSVLGNNYSVCYAYHMMCYKHALMFRIAVCVY